MFSLESLAAGAAASLVASILNRPGFPAFGKVGVVLACSVVGAVLQRAASGAVAWPPTAEQVAQVFAGAAVAYHAALKHLGGDWLEKTITPEVLRELFAPPVEAEPAPVVLDPLEGRLKQLEGLLQRGLLKTAEYEVLRAQALGLMEGQG